MSLLDIRNLAFGYPHHPVGHDMQLRLEAGEVVALLGPNGSGKTTLFRTILGWLRPLAGEVHIAGESVAAWTRGRMARWLGYVPQVHGGFFPFTTLDVVLMGRTAHLRAVRRAVAARPRRGAGGARSDGGGRAGATSLHGVVGWGAAAGPHRAGPGTGAAACW